MGILDRAKIWLRSADVRTLVAIGLLVFGLWGFFGLASEMVEGETRSIDEWILIKLREPGNLSIPIGPSWLADTMRDITALGSGSVLTLVTTIVVATLALARQYSTSVYILGTISLAQVANSFLKYAYARTRPDIVPHLARVTSESFPSGHSMMSAVVYMTVGSLVAATVEDRKLKILIIAVAGGITFAVGFSRIYLGVHYPSDVLAGWAVGVTWAIATGLLVQLHRRYSPERT